MVKARGQGAPLCASSRNVREVEVLPCVFKSPLSNNLESRGFGGGILLRPVGGSREWLPMMTASALECFGDLPVGTLQTAVKEDLQEGEDAKYDLFACCEHLLRKHVDPAFPDTEEGLSVLRKRMQTRR